MKRRNFPTGTRYKLGRLINIKYGVKVKINQTGKLIKLKIFARINQFNQAKNFAKFGHSCNERL